MIMNKRYKGARKKTTVCLCVFLAIMSLLGGTLLAFADNGDGATSFSRYYVTNRHDVSCQDPDCRDADCLATDYQVDKVIVSRVKKQYTVRFFLAEGSLGVLVGSVKVDPGDCIPPYESIEGVATVTTLIVSPEEFHGWYYYDLEGERVDVPDPADVTVLRDMDLFADVEPRLPRAIKFVFYGYEAKQIPVLINGVVEQKWIANLDLPPVPVYTSYVLDGEYPTSITWMFVEEAYNRWQVRNFYKNPTTGVYDIPSGLQPGMKPEFFAYPYMMWKVYDNSIEAGGNLVAERGYNDFYYVPTHPTNPDLVNTFYMDYAIEKPMEFLEIEKNERDVDYLVATFHVYPIHSAEYIPWDGGGVQGEDEE